MNGSPEEPGLVRVGSCQGWSCILVIEDSARKPTYFTADQEFLPCIQKPRGFGTLHNDRISILCSAVCS